MQTQQNKCLRGRTLQILSEKPRNEEKSWLSIIERLRNQIFDLKEEKRDLKDEIKDLKTKNRELAKFASF